MIKTNFKQYMHTREGSLWSFFPKICLHAFWLYKITKKLPKNESPFSFMVLFLRMFMCKIVFLDFFINLPEHFIVLFDLSS